MFPQSVIEKFWDRVEKPHGPDGCWFYGGVDNAFQYRTFNYAPGRSTSAHKFAYLASGGNIPDGYVLRHRCAVGGCCNPDHLVPGTYKENSMDWAAREFAGIQPGVLATYETVDGYTHSTLKLQQDKMNKYRSGRCFQDVVERARLAGLSDHEIRAALELALQL